MTRKSRLAAGLTQATETALVSTVPKSDLAVWMFVYPAQDVVGSQIVDQTRRAAMYGCTDWSAQTGAACTCSCLDGTFVFGLCATLHLHVYWLWLQDWICGSLMSGQLLGGSLCLSLSGWNDWLLCISILVSNKWKEGMARRQRTVLFKPFSS